jgi:hypothetical protein
MDVKDFANISSEMPKSGDGEHFDTQDYTTVDEPYEIFREEA